MFLSSRTVPCICPHLERIIFRKSLPLVQYSVQSNETTAPALTSFNKSALEDRGVKISKAMKAYLDRAKKHDEFMAEETAEFELGKRHLANIMGADPETFTQRDIDSAVQYLMPSGLFDWRARPMMKDPKELFPAKKEAQFDKTGRPYNTFFYTNRSSYYELLHNISASLQQLNNFEDDMIRKGIAKPPEEALINLSGSEWLTQIALEELIMESVTEHLYKYFLISMSNLVAHPYANLKRDFIMKYRKQLVSSSGTSKGKPLTIGEDGRSYATAIGSRKRLRNSVTVYGNGTGKVDINGQDISFFFSIQDREQLMFPLQFTGLLNEVDIVAQVDTSVGGHSGWAGSLRHGLSRALISFVTPEMVEKMRIAGLLQRDIRTSERKKPGQKGARAKFTWNKR